MLRVLPKGAGSVDQAGVNFYVGLVNALQLAGIEPYVTLCAPAWKPYTTLSGRVVTRRGLWSSAPGWLPATSCP